MDNVEAMLQQQAGSSANNDPSPYDGTPVVVSGLPQQQTDPLEAMLQQRAKENTPPVSDRHGQSIDPHAGEYSSIGNLGYGALKGLADLVQAPAQIALHGANFINQKLPGGGSSALNNATNQFDNYLKNQEQLYQLDTPGSITAGIGRAAANTIPFLATGGGSSVPQAATMTSKAAQLGSQLAQGAGLTMATQPVNDVNNDFLQQKVTQGALGAGGTAIGAGLGKALGGIISPTLSPALQAAKNEGITPTIGQALGGGWANMENKLTSVPIIGDMIKNAQRSTTEDFNRAAYNRVVEPIRTAMNRTALADAGMTNQEINALTSAQGKSVGANYPVGHEGVAAIQNEVHAAYDNLLPKLKFKGDNQLSNELVNLAGMVNNGNLPPATAAQFNAIVKNNVLSRMTQGGTMDGTQFKTMQSDLGKIIYNNKQSNPELSGALSEVMNSLKGSLTRSNPTYAPQLDAINNGFANLTRVERAASGVGTDNGVFTPAQLANAVKAGDSSARKNASARGDALMQDLVNTGKTIAPTYPDSGTAGRTALIPSLAALAVGGATHPVATGLAVGGGALASLPYSATGKKLAAALMMNRPQSAPVLANGVRASAPALGAVLSGMGVPVLNQYLNNGK